MWKGQVICPYEVLQPTTAICYCPARCVTTLGDVRDKSLYVWEVVRVGVHSFDGCWERIV